jgi:hypothetical protein
MSFCQCVPIERVNFWKVKWRVERYVFFVCFFDTVFVCVIQAALKLSILLPQPHGCWDYRTVPLHRAMSILNIDRHYSSDFPCNTISEPILYTLILWWWLVWALSLCPFFSSVSFVVSSSSFMNYWCFSVSLQDLIFFSLYTLSLYNVIHCFGSISNICVYWGLNPGSHSC